jgi:hypothetical protein
MPCPEGSGPSPDPSLVETRLKRCEDCSKCLVVVPQSCVEATGTHRHGGVDGVQPEKPVKYALCWIFQPAGSHPDIRFSAGNLTKHRYVRLRGTGCTKPHGAPHARRGFVNISQASACWDAQDAVSIGFQPVGHRHSFFNSNPPNRLRAEYRRQNADNLLNCSPLLPSRSADLETCSEGTARARLFKVSASENHSALAAHPM